MERVNVLGVGVSPVSLSQTVATMESWVSQKARKYVCLVAAHSLLDCHRDAYLRRLFNASGISAPDGMSIVWLLKVHGHTHVTRVYGPDLMLATCQAFVSNGYGHFFLGGGPGVPELLANRLTERVPGLRVSGTLSPPFGDISEEEDHRIVEVINQARPDLLWVGLGSTRQERWMAEHRSMISAPVLVGVGAAFDFVSGLKPQAPNWMQRSGLEWLFRLFTEPRRLGRRYAAYPWFIALVLLQFIGVKRYRMES